MLANFSHPGTSLRPRLTVPIATVVIAATLAGGVFAMASSSMSTAYRASGEVKILADVGWNSPTPKATP